MDDDEARQEARENLHDTIVERHGLGLVSDGADEITAELYGVVMTDLSTLLQVSEVAQNVHHIIDTWPDDADQYDGLIEAAGEFVKLTTKAGWEDHDQFLAARRHVADEMEMTARRTIHGWPT